MQTQNHSYKRKRSIKDRVAINKNNWEWYAKLFQVLIDGSVRYVNSPVLGPLLKKIVAMDKPEKHFTQGYVINLNVKLDERNQNIVLPVNVIKKAIEGSSFRSILHKCLCRTSRKCQNYDIDFGCIFIGEGARSIVRNGIGHEVTVEEALKHVDKAVGSGLVGQCLWIEAERLMWGVKNEDTHKFLEICFCCPCCCIALRNFRNVGPDIRQRFRAIGWKSSYIGGCDSCGICEDNCPMEAIKVINNAISVSDQCLGCGICAAKCPQNAIEIEMISSQKDCIQDYFHGFRPDV